MPKYRECVTTLMIQQVLGIRRHKQYRITPYMNYMFEEVQGRGRSYYIPVDILPNFFSQVIRPDYGNLLKTAEWKEKYEERVKELVKVITPHAVKVPA